MPIINLTIHGKAAKGDGTKIVCMNSDYAVNILCEDCDTFVNSPVKKLIIKSGWKYLESPILPVEGNPSVLHAELPPIDAQATVELGVCGKEIDDPKEEPKFTSMPAVFDCAKSILCGAVILKKDPVFSALTVTENGVYKSIDSGVDGFYEVDVEVPKKFEETLRVELSMRAGDQVIVPTYGDSVIKQVTITKPVYLIPENIRKGTVIGGVHGTFENLIGQPIEVLTSAEMEYILQNATDANVGYIYKYIGESTPTYEQNAMYIIEAVSEDV